MSERLNFITAVILFSEISGNLGNAAVLSLTNGTNIKRFAQLKLFFKKNKPLLMRWLILAQMERFARLASALGGTHPGTKTVHRTVSMLRIALFESLY